MASGFGLYGGRGPCHSFWQNYLKCTADATDEKTCKLFFEDYHECLHHRKELERQQQIKDQLLANRGLKPSTKPEQVSKSERTNVASLDILPSLQDVENKTATSS